MSIFTYFCWYKITAARDAILLQTFLQAMFTDPFCKQADLINAVSMGFLFRYPEVLPAGRLLADLTVKMQVPVFMGLLITTVVA